MPVRALKALVSKAPAPLLEAARVAYDFLPPGVRYGKDYREALRFLDAAASWDREAVTAFQEERLRAMVRHCAANVPYYRSLFRTEDIGADDVKTLADLKKLPFLTRSVVRARAKDLIAENIPAGAGIPSHTSGTTGSPLDFFWTKAVFGMDRALARRHLIELGYEQGDRIAALRGELFADPTRRYRYFPGSKQMIFSLRAVDDAGLAEIVDALEKFRPQFIRAFPSTLYIVAKWMERNRRLIHPPKYLVTSSETLFPHQRELAEGVFEAPVADWYGHNEGTIAAGQCRYVKHYHVRFELGILELEPGDSGDNEIVGTTLNNMVMPLLRYRTGDVGIPASDPCPCGTEHPLLAGISGRVGDMIITPERRIISSSVIDYCFYHLPEIKEGRIVQEDLYNVAVEVVPWEHISEETKTRLLGEIEGHLQSRQMKVEYREVDLIPTTSGGKRPIVVSKVKAEDFL
ncbi:MAG: phenylacetate--CoA ligase family protein [Pseudomonadota bacterium]